MSKWRDRRRASNLRGARDLPEWARNRELPGAWAARRAREIARGRRVSPLLLLDYLDHPLVRAHMTSTRRRRRCALAVCAAIPAAAWLVTLVLLASHGPSLLLARMAAAFLWFWPLVMFLGGVMAPAAGTVAERESGTAIQLVLSRIKRRPIAAAKVLPYAPVFTIGVLAALPLYVMIGSSGALLIDGEVPNLLSFWPWRALALGSGDWRITFTPLGAMLGVMACVSDAAAAWAAAHWGAGMAVRLGNMVLVGVFTVMALARLLLGTLVIWGVSLLVGAAAAVALEMLTRAVAEVGVRDSQAVLWATVWGSAAYCAGLWLFLRMWPVRYALAGFEHFDRLADEEFQPRLRDHLSFRAWREHIFTGRA
jgi:hypothetical protein